MRQLLPVSDNPIAVRTDEVLELAQAVAGRCAGLWPGRAGIRILLHETDIDALIRMRLLKEDRRHDVEALQTAVILYRAEGDLA